MLEKFRSQITAFIAAIAVIIVVQTPHLAWVFSSLSELPDYWPILHGVAYALAVDLGILYFAVKGKREITLFFMFMSGAGTVFYYWDKVLEAMAEGDWFRFIVIILFGIAPAVIVYFTSEEFADTEDNSVGQPDEFLSKDQWQEKIDSQIIQMKNSGHSYDEIQKHMGVGRTRIAEVLKEAA